MKHFLALSLQFSIAVLYVNVIRWKFALHILVYVARVACDSQELDEPQNASRSVAVFNSRAIPQLREAIFEIPALVLCSTSARIFR